MNLYNAKNLNYRSAHLEFAIVKIVKFCSSTVWIHECISWNNLSFRPVWTVSVYQDTEQVV